MDHSITPEEGPMTGVIQETTREDAIHDSHVVISMDNANGQTERVQAITSSNVTTYGQRPGDVIQPLLPGLIHLNSDASIPQSISPNLQHGSTTDKRSHYTEVAESDTIANRSNADESTFQETVDGTLKSSGGEVMDFALPNEADSDYESAGEQGVEFDSDPYASDEKEHLEVIEDSTDAEDFDEDEILIVDQTKENVPVQLAEVLSIVQDGDDLEKSKLDETIDAVKPKKQPKQLDDLDDMDPEESSFFGLNYQAEIPDIILDPQTALLKLGNVVSIIPPERPNKTRKFKPTKSVESTQDESPGEMVVITIHNEDEEGRAGGEIALDAGTVVFIEDKRVIGIIADIIGPVRDPYYLVAFKDWNLIENFDIKVGIPVFVVEQHNKMVQLPGLTRRKTGQDEAYDIDSILYDEPADDGEFDDSDVASTPPFSSDEKEVKFREQRDAKRQRKRPKKKNSRGQKMEGRGNFRTGKRRAEEFAEDGEIEDGYTRLQRPGTFNNDTSQHSRAHENRGGRGGRGGYGNRPFQQDRSSSQSQGRQSYGYSNPQQSYAPPTHSSYQSTSPQAPPFMIPPGIPSGVVPPPLSFPGGSVEAQKLVDQMLENLVKERVQDQVNAVLKSLGVPGSSNVPLPNASYGAPPPHSLSSTNVSGLPGLSPSSTFMPQVGTAGQPNYGYQSYGHQIPQQTAYNYTSQPPLSQQTGAYGEQQNAPSAQNDGSAPSGTAEQPESLDSRHLYNPQNTNNHPYGRR